ncbi:hypothetical protein [Nocardia crassostreae]|uniref:hypothetical protein n=1 Tax=Nocardia crassostreae TaxID=53428 RepID=UPI00082C90FF|nr:hypothetical protein [Nocardia crassostreae]
MSGDAGDRKRFVIGLFAVTVVTPVLAGLTAFIGALGVVWMIEARKRLGEPGERRGGGAVRDPLPRLAAQRPPRRGENRGPSRPGNRRSGRIMH